MYLYSYLLLSVKVRCFFNKDKSRKAKEKTMEIEVKKELWGYEDYPINRHEIRYSFFADDRQVFLKDYCISEDPMKIAKDVREIANNIKMNLKDI